MRICPVILLVSLALASCTEKTEAPSPPEPTPEVKAKPERTAEVQPEVARPIAAVEDAPSPPDADPEPPEPDLKIGAIYVLGQGEETVVMNPKPVDDGLRRFARGSVCRVDPEGKVKIVGKRRAKMEDEAYDEYLVRYARDPAPVAIATGAIDDADAQPYECPDGTVFFIEDTTMLEEDEPDARFEAARKILNSEKP